MSITARSNNHLDIELDELPRPAPARIPAERGARGPGTILQQLNAPNPRRAVNAAPRVLSL
jgi:hypothetical protein